MKRSISAALTMLGLLLCVRSSALAQPSSGPSQGPSAEEVQAILNARAASIPGSGIVAAVNDRGRFTTYIAGTSGTSRPLDAHTLFEIGSVTKTFTATALASMVLANTVKPSDPVSRYLPSAVHVPSRKGTAITLLTLATQHSGLPRLPTNMVDTDGADPYARYTVAALYKFLDGYKLTRDPGVVYEYSNLGFGLLGLALTHAAHAPSYEALVQADVWKPLQMNESATTLSPAERAMMAVGHTVDGDEPHTWEFTDAIAGAGAIRSDLTDMVKYPRCNMGQGPLARTCVLAQQPRSTFPGGRIGFAWETDPSTGSIGHGGDTAGYHASIMLNASRSKGVVLLSSGPAVEDIGAHLLDARYLIVPERKSASLPAALLDEYVGTYANPLQRITYVITRKDGRLDARIVGQTAAGIYSSRWPDHFYYKVVSAYIEFVRDSGRVVGLILTQGDHVPVYRLDAAGKPMASSLEPAYPAALALDTTTLHEYTGTYAMDGAQDIVTLKNGHLFVQLSGQEPYEVYPSAKDEFYYKIVDAQLSFHRDTAGNVSGLTLHQDGNDIDAHRLRTSGPP